MVEQVHYVLVLTTMTAYLEHKDVLQRHFPHIVCREGRVELAGHVRISLHVTRNVFEWAAHGLRIPYVIRTDPSLYKRPVVTKGILDDIPII